MKCFRFIVMLLILTAGSQAFGQAQIREGMPDRDASSTMARTRSEVPAAPSRVPGTLGAGERDSADPGGASPARHLFGDVDGDGLDDLFVLDRKGNLLFRNLGDGSFKDMTAQAFPEGAGCGVAGFFGDYDGDGIPDLFLFHEEGFSLYRNDGKFHFTNVTKSLGLDPSLTPISAKLSDYDGDGFSDLLVSTPEGDRIYRNRQGLDFGAINLSGSSSGQGRKGGGSGSFTGRPGSGAASPGGGPEEMSLWSDSYVNDNSPGSVGIGVPEVEGGEDTVVSNDIVDGTVTGADIQDQSLTGADIQDQSLPPTCTAGTAATLTGSQNFDAGTLFIDAADHCVGIGTTGPYAKLDVLADGDYGIYSTVTGATAVNYGIMGRSHSSGGTGVRGLSDYIGVSGQSDGAGGKGVYGEGEQGVCGYSTALSGKGVSGHASNPSSVTYGVFGQSDSGQGLGVAGLATAGSGNAYGVYGVSNSSEGHGVYGYATASSGETSGVFGRCSSSDGAGVHGWATDLLGWGLGVEGRSDSDYGSGVYGHATSTSGFTEGVYGISESTLGRGVLGYAFSPTGETVGLFGQSDSTSGKGLFALASATSGNTYGAYVSNLSTQGTGVYVRSEYGKAVDALTSSNSEDPWVPAIYGKNEGAGDGVYGWSQNRNGTVGVSYADEGRGVYGYVSKNESLNYGVEGVSASEIGTGVRGYSPVTNGAGYGVEGESDGPSGVGVYGTAPFYGVIGHAEQATGHPMGVLGESAAEKGIAVSGWVAHSTGINKAVEGATNSPNGYGVYSVGKFAATGSKSFVQPHPSDPSKEIHFVCLEGNENGTYFRGSAKLEGGRAVIEVPEEFRLVTEPEGITVQVTPLGPGRIWVERYGLNEILICGDVDVEFHYFVNGVRRGYGHHEPIRANHGYVPRVRGEPFGTQYPEAIRRILVENGILNPDLTPNEATAAKMGWKLREPDEVRPWLKREAVSRKKNSGSAFEPRDLEHPHRKAFKMKAKKPEGRFKSRREETPLVPSLSAGRDR